MFDQNVFLIKGTDSSPADHICAQLLKIGYNQDQLFSIIASDYKKKDTPRFEVILLVYKDMECPPGIIQKLNTDFPDIPLILVADVVPGDEVLPAGIDDWLLQSWLEPLLLKKTLLLAMERKKNSYNYARIFRENPSPMYIYQKDTFSFLEVNIAALRQYGYSKADFLQMNAKDIRPSSELDAFLKINEELPANYADAGIWQHTRKNAEVFYVHVFTHDILFAGKSCKLVMAIDIDNEVKAENAIKKKALEIEMQNKKLKEIAWVQAHQIRGPVSNLIGLVDLFNVDEPDDPDNLELLARIKHTAIQMDESIKEIVYLTQKIES
ncbi:PAS domain S-box-containing protein [Pedobacter africanus]|uniref:PAS domain S-box-containing protein n=1 Tax=Pedobacter africanus TaxID=151894 RepID=A0ACC6KWD1_9SPHI|nr:PAS domain S-box protein [Pedobacter africanus]MDR6783393.1 PAS domain S-box-containing protein [Pedobacter africanus]